MPVAGRKVVAWVPYGRHTTFNIQVPYLIQAHLDGVIDRVKRPGPETPEMADRIPADWMLGYRRPKQMNTCRYFVYAAEEPDNVYVRFDDDIVWMERNAIKNLVQFKLDHPELLGVFPVIWNNAVSSHIMQKWGHFPMSWGAVSEYAVDPVGWGSPHFAERVHELLLHHITNDHADACVEMDRYEVLGWRVQFSVSCFAIEGREYVAPDLLLPGVLDWDEEEHWLTQYRTGVVKRSNAVYGGAHVAHFSFYTQRDYLLSRTSLLPRYGALADTLAHSLGDAWCWH
jgi:hypothetical protein